MLAPSLPGTSSGLSKGLSLLLCMCLVGVSLGCASDPRTVTSSSIEDHWEAWQVVETKTGRVLAYPDWLTDLASHDIVYLGEEHYNPHHVEAALRLLSSFMAEGLRPAIGMEMFGWDGQEALDRYLTNRISEKSAFLEQAKWASNWGGGYENYEPLVRFAQERQVPLLAMNPPKALIRRVVKLGLAEARDDPAWQQWGMAPQDIIDDPSYRAKIFDQLRRCHGGGAEEDYRTMYEASMVRDEGMAQTVVALLGKIRREQPDAPTIVLSYTGGGHIQYNLPIPSRVARRLSGQVRQATVYLASLDRTKTTDMQELLKEPIADYLWLTPMSGQGPVERCR
jgi:uncharacterized iron-regulated protein